MDKVKNINLPVSYSVDSFDSERFLKLRVKVMHTGLNLNNSTFGLSSIEAAKPTLANIPLLAFVKKVDGEEVESDFAGHEYEIKIREGDNKFVYLGRPIGIIPETNNYSMEVDPENGETYVYADAYVWKQYANSALDILDRDQVKKISMEIIVDDYVVNESSIDIAAYRYTGIALLGEDVKEAMIGAKAEVVKFSEVSIASMMNELKDAMAEVFTIRNASNLKTPGPSPRPRTQEPEVKKEVEKPVVIEEPVITEEDAPEIDQLPNSEIEGVDLKNEAHIPSEPEAPSTEAPVLPGEQKPEKPEETAEEVEETEETEVEQEEIVQLEDEDMNEPVKVEDHIILEDDEYTIKELPNKKPLKVAMPEPQGATNVDTSEDDDEDDLHRVDAVDPVDPVDPVDDPEDPVDNPEEEGNSEPDNEDEGEPEDEFARLEAIIISLKEENKKLKEYKANIEKEQFEAQKAELLAEFTDLEESELNDLQAQDLSLDALEINLYALRGKKVKVERPAKLGILDASAHFAKKVKVEPEYADLIRQHTQR